MANGNTTAPKGKDVYIGSAAQSLRSAKFLRDEGRTLARAVLKSTVTSEDLVKLTSLLDGAVVEDDIE